MAKQPSRRRSSSAAAAATGIRFINVNGSVNTNYTPASMRLGDILTEQGRDMRSTSVSINGRTCSNVDEILAPGDRLVFSPKEVKSARRLA